MVVVLVKVLKYIVRRAIVRNFLKVFGVSFLGGTVAALVQALAEAMKVIS